MILLGITAILGIGILAQLISWHLRIPSIILLLVFGMIAGPWTGWLKPDVLFGSSFLSSLITLAVGLILFEGGLSLCFKEISDVRQVTIRLILVGALISWGLTALAAILLLGIEPRLAILLGAILVVTGPTVMLPMLQAIRPNPPLDSILRWEGIMIDPLGATLAVLVFDSLLLNSLSQAANHAVVALFKTIVFGGLFGFLAAWLLVWLLEHEWLPEFLSTTFTLSLVCVVLVAANHVQDESGLLAVTLMGLALGNQKKVIIRHVIDFSETLGLILVATLFVTLSARIRWEDLQQLGWGAFVFLLVMIVLVRPLSVILSTAGSSLSRSERWFIAVMAPRGIVAAAVASVFALRLQNAGYPSAQKLVPIVFLVIFGTVVFYGLLTPIMARWLAVRKENPQGILFVGAQSWVQALASLLQEEGFLVRLLDSNPHNVFAARMKGLDAQRKNVLSESALDAVLLGGIGRVLAVTPNDNVNSLAVVHFQHDFDKDQIYQIACHPLHAKDASQQRSETLRGRILFQSQLTQQDISQRFTNGSSFKRTRLTEQFTYDDWLHEYGTSAIPLFLIDETQQITPITSEQSISPSPGCTLISLVP